jgi:hypothetical protein
MCEKTKSTPECEEKRKRKECLSLFSFVPSLFFLDLQKAVRFVLKPFLEIATWLILPVAYACLKD